MLASASGTMANNGSYSNDRTTAAGDLEYAADPASGGFFHSDYKKHEDLKEMLDSNKDGLKLEAMKRIIGMVAKGRDASELFPAVVKNVVSKNIEVKKLVYVYLVRYAEEQQDLALLSISTFQRALKDPNQLIRAGALRVLSSIRVSMIVPIVMLAIRDAAADMSPYVRKTAAHAIPKLYNLDPEQKSELVGVIERLLADRTTLVVGSAVMAFEEVCPERVDLVHKNYRKLCTLLVDVDEWGQVIILNMLTRYARTQFIDPNLHNNDDRYDSDKPFYGSSDDESSNDENKGSSMDADHRLLLRTARPLLQSRNASVVMAVVQLYHHAAPRQEVTMAAKALIRLLRSHTEVQSIVLNAVASISIQRKGMFEPYLKSFFVRTSDLTHIKLLKLDILTNLATEGNVSIILRELQTYITSSDKIFVAASIQAIGRCACNIQEVTDMCLNGLVSLLSSKDEAVVAESVVVIKRLLQTQAAEPGDIVAQMARLLDTITVAQARAAILWLLGEHSARVTRIAPDVLRKLAKSFVEEHDIVKLQILNLAVKLWLTNREQTALLCQYVLNLARYDQSYDIRDRARFLRHFTLSADANGILASKAAHVFLAPKPAPLLQSRFKDREQFQLGSLSHYINARAAGYRDLPAFPIEPPPSSVRDSAVPSEVVAHITRLSKQKPKKKSFYSESEEVSSAEEPISENESSENTDDSSEESSEEDDESTSASENFDNLGKKRNSKHSSNDVKSSDQNDSTDENSDESDEGTSDENSSDTSAEGKSKFSASDKPLKDAKPEPKSNLDLLLDLDDIPAITPIMTPSLGGFLTPMAGSIPLPTNGIHPIPPIFIPKKTSELLNRINGRGLSITYRFTRSPHLFSPTMASVELLFTNSGTDDITDIKVGQKKLPVGMSIHDFACIAVLSPGCSLPGTLGVDFNDSTQPASFEILSSAGNANVNIRAPIGELIRAVNMSDTTFNTERARLKGMHEHDASIQVSLSKEKISELVLQTANLTPIICQSEDNILKYAGQTLSSGSLVLMIIKPNEENVNISVHCEKIVVGSMLLNELKSCLRF